MTKAGHIDIRIRRSADIDSYWTSHITCNHKVNPKAMVPC